MSRFKVLLVLGLLCLGVYAVTEIIRRIAERRAIAKYERSQAD
jgi:hypothetical protein